jgi:hypothetical protein
MMACAPWRRHPLAHQHGGEDHQKISVTCGQASVLSEACSCRPMPPAPTRPSTVDSRMLMSQRNTVMPGEGRQDLRHDAVVDHLRAGGAGGAIASTCVGVDLLDRLVEQLADEADRAQRDGDDAGQHAGPEDRDQQQRPDQRVDRARRDDDEQRQRPHEQRARRGVARGQEGHRHGDHDAEQGAERGDVDRVPQRPARAVPCRTSAAAPCARRCRRPGAARPDEGPDRVLRSSPASRRRTAPRANQPPAQSAPSCCRASCAPPDRPVPRARRPASLHPLATKPDEYSAAMTMAMMMIRIAAGVSYS